MAGDGEVELPLHGGELVVILERGRRGAIADLVGCMAANPARQVGELAALVGERMGGGVVGRVGVEFRGERRVEDSERATFGGREAVVLAGPGRRGLGGFGGEGRDVGLNCSARNGLELGRGGADRRGEVAGTTPGQETQREGQHHAATNHESIPHHSNRHNRPIFCSRTVRIAVATIPPCRRRDISAGPSPSRSWRQSSRSE